jgi:hypothetical protein
LPENSEEIVQQVWKKLGKWRRLLVVLDGRSGLGKSVYGRYLSFRLNFPVFELDNFKTGHGIFAHSSCIYETVRLRLTDDRPVLVEGLCSAKVMQMEGLQVDCIVRLEHPDFLGPEEFRVASEEYEQAYSPDLVALAKYFRPYSDWLKADRKQLK